MAKERLTRSTSDRWVAGVCGGIARYLGWDADMLRLIWVVLTVGTAFCGVLIYLVLWLLMPQNIYVR